MDDCIIIGAGPAGLTAAIYLSRYLLSIRLFDSGDSRAALIPCTHNHAGFPGGISGKDLLDRMREQARDFGAIREEKRVEHLARLLGGVRAVQVRHRVPVDLPAQDRKVLADLLDVEAHDDALPGPKRPR